MISKDTTANFNTIYYTVRTKLIDEYFPINEDQEKEVLDRNKALREQFLQNVRSPRNISSSLFKIQKEVSSSSEIDNLFEIDKIGVLFGLYLENPHLQLEI